MIISTTSEKVWTASRANRGYRHAQDLGIKNCQKLTYFSNFDNIYSFGIC